MNFPEQENEELRGFINAVVSRRSVRFFEKTPIPESIMHACLDLALLAPNSANLQPWEFYWVRSHEKKFELARACLSQPAAVTAAELVVCIARTQTWRANSKKMLLKLDEEAIKVPDAVIHYYKRIIPFVYSLGPLNLFGFIKKLLYFFSSLLKPTPRLPASKSDMVLWATKSCALAAENLMLALRAYSYDSCPMEGFDVRMVKKILDLPSDAHVVMIIGAGKRAPNGIYGSQIRFERDLFVKEI